MQRRRNEILRGGTCRWRCWLFLTVMTVGLPRSTALPVALRFVPSMLSETLCIVPLRVRRAILTYTTGFRFNFVKGENRVTV